MKTQIVFFWQITKMSLNRSAHVNPATTVMVQNANQNLRSLLSFAEMKQGP